MSSIIDKKSTMMAIYIIILAYLLNHKVVQATCSWAHIVFVFAGSPECLPECH